MESWYNPVLFSDNCLVKNCRERLAASVYVELEVAFARRLDRMKKDPDDEAEMLVSFRADCENVAPSMVFELHVTFTLKDLTDMFPEETWEVERVYSLP